MTYTSPNAYMHDFDANHRAPLAGYPPPENYPQPYTLPEYIAVMRLRLGGLLEEEFDSELMRSLVPGTIMRLEDKINQWENYQRLIEERN